MLSIFPELLAFSFLGVFLVRAVVGLAVFFLAIKITFIHRKKIAKKLEGKIPAANFFVWMIGLVGLIAGNFMIIGFLTQISALVCAYFLFNISFIERDQKRILDQSKLFYLTMAFISLSFLFLGPGAFSIDLPL